MCKMYTAQNRFEYWTDGKNTICKDLVDRVIRPLSENISPGKMTVIDEVPADVKQMLDNFDKLVTMSELKGYGWRAYDNDYIERGRPGNTIGVKKKTGDYKTLPEDYSMEEDRIWIPTDYAPLSHLIFKLRVGHLYINKKSQCYIGAFESIDDSGFVTLNRGGVLDKMLLSDIEPCKDKVRSLDTGELIDYRHGMRATDIIGPKSIIFGDVVQTKHDDYSSYYIHLELEPKALQQNQWARSPVYLVNDEVIDYDIVCLEGNLGYNIQTDMPCLFEGNWAEANRRKMRERYFKSARASGFDDLIDRIKKLDSDEWMRLVGTIMDMGVRR